VKNNLLNRGYEEWSRTVVGPGYGGCNTLVYTKGDNQANERSAIFEAHYLYNSGDSTRALQFYIYVFHSLVC
jgi:hypothetical protein